MIDRYEAEDVLWNHGCELVNSDESVCSLISEATATGVGPDWVDVHSVWRGKGGVPQFLATIYFKGEDWWSSVLSDTIIAKVRGTFKETRNGLVVEACFVEECDFDQSHADAANAYWESVTG